MVEAPVDQAAENNDSDPFQSLIPISLAVEPPFLESNENADVPEQYYELELAKKFNFVLDLEADHLIPQHAVEFSYQRKPWPYTQLVHRSGVAFIQILPQKHGFIWVNNRLHLANSTTRGASVPSPTLLRLEFEQFCRDPVALQDFWLSKKGALSTHFVTHP